MKIVLHAGLHKSGTTTIQYQWRAAYRDPREVWYPALPGTKLPGHHAVMWPLLDAYREQSAADLVWSKSLNRALFDLREVVAEAVAKDVRVLVFSTEELDRLQPADVPRFQEILEPHDVVTVFTATRPLHRWSSGWQELVKHGLHEYPRDAAADIMSFASLTPGRLEQLTGLLPAERRIVRIVRTTPIEESLPEDLSALLGLEWPDVDPEPVRNVSLGADTEIVRRINRADLAMGTLHGGGRDRLNKIKLASPDYATNAELADAYQLPAEFWEAAKLELDFLSRGGEGSSVEVSDPHEQLRDWLDPEPPSWYAAISEREAVVPELDSPRGLSESLWRVRQERSALRANLDNTRKRASSMQSEMEQLRRRHQQALDRATAAQRDAERRVAEIERSRSWRLTRPLRATTQRLKRQGG